MSALALLAAGAGAAFLALERYRKTNHGENPWTLEALTNAIVYSSHYERFLALIDDTDGEPNSVYRSERINTAVGGVKESRHLKALACDGKPKRLSLKAAQDIVYAAAMRGELGPVKRVTAEPNRGAVHVEWWAQNETARPPVKSEWNG